MIHKYSHALLSLILALALLFSLSVPSLAAEEKFSDIPDDYWASEYVYALTKAGYFSGYANGTFKPDGVITYCETFALLSRFYSPNTEARNLINEKYLSDVSSIVPSSLSWSWDEISICLAAGIISIDELKTLNLTEHISKEDFSFYSVRAIQLKDKAAELSSRELPFKDLADISEKCRGSVALMYLAELVNGDELGNFNPKSDLTRAVSAAMLYRTIKYISGLNLDFSLSAFSGFVSGTGIVSGVSGNTVRIMAYNGIVREYYTVEGTAVNVNGKAAAFNEVCVGGSVKFTEKDNIITRADVTKEDKVTFVTGKVYSISSFSEGSINITPTGDKVNKRYSLPKTGAVIERSGKAVELSELYTGDYVVLTVKDGYATEIIASDDKLEISGSLNSLVFGTTVELRLTDAEGKMYYLGFDIAALPKIYVANHEITIDQLTTGTKLTAYYESGSFTKLVAEGTENTLTGVLNSTTETLDGTTWELKIGTSLVKLRLDANVSVYKGKNSIRLSDIKLGDTVTVTVYNDRISSVTLDSTKPTTTTKLTGEVLKVDTSERQITLLVNDKLYYVDVPGGTIICNSANGKEIGLSLVSQNSIVLLYGSYTGSTTFAATLVIVEALAS